jgi:uncharacterized membrane protein
MPESPIPPPSTRPIHRGRELAALLLAAVGILASLATLYASPIEGVTDLGCGVRVMDCSEALGSVYGKIAGIPLGVAGGFYFAFWGLFVAAVGRSRAVGYRWVVTLTLTLGGVMSLVFLWLLAFVIKAPCFWCLVTHACNLGAYALWWPSRVWRIGRTDFFAMLKGAVALAVAAALLGLGFFQLYQLRVVRAEAVAREKTIW